jgi:hypothetical protein
MPDTVTGVVTVVVESTPLHPASTRLAAVSSTVAITVCVFIAWLVLAWLVMAWLQALR